MRFRPGDSRNVRPLTKDWLWSWVHNYTGIRLARNAVCRGHSAPFDALACWQLDRPSISLCLGSRGSGKTFMSALDLHLDSRFRARHESRILGGSKAQSQQAYQGIDEAVMGGSGPGGNDRDVIESFRKEAATYRNGSTIKILTASPLSVRGPHVPSMKLDEVDEIDVDVRDAAMGMLMAKAGHPAKLVMTSTWHNLGGPMTDLIDRAREERWPFHSFCAFEVLERCPESRSGPYVGGDEVYRDCPECPLQRWCHAEKDVNGGIPLAKLADGHYAIESLAQKTEMVSERVFEADYLCRGPKADGVWFSSFADKDNVSDAAEFDPSLPVHFAYDTGLRSAGIYFQVRPSMVRGRPDHLVTVYAEYYAEGLTPESNVAGIRAVAHEFGDRLENRYTDPAGRARNAVGTITLGEYEAAGLTFGCWPLHSVRDGLALVEGLVKLADGTVRLLIHPRCKGLIAAMKAYRRKKLRGSFIDQPEDPQHPHENYVDALRGGLVSVFGLEGHKPRPNHPRLDYRRVF